MGELATSDAGFTGFLGLEQVGLDPDRVELRLSITDAHRQPYGLVHGGVWCSAVETAASTGADLWWGDRGEIVGVANHTDFIRGVRGGSVSIVATPIHRGRTQQLWLVEIRDEQDRLVARGEVRIQNLGTSAALGH